MTPEERAEVAPAADNFESLFGARAKKPVSVKAAETAIGFTPVGSAVEIGEELSKEDPSYGKVAVIAAGDVLGTALPVAAPVVKTLIGSGRGIVKDVDDLVDTWAKGDISNKELRDSAKELGVEINTKRITKNRDPSDIQIAMPDGKVYTGVDTIPNPAIDPEYVKGLTKPAETDALQELGLTDEALEAWKAENYSKDKYRVARIEKVEDAAKALREGKITSAKFRELSDAYQPIVPIEEMPDFPTKVEVVQALHATDKRKVAKGIIGVNKTIQDGTPISARLDIPAYNDTDTWVVSLHDGTAKNGDTVGYAQTAVLNNVNFTTNPLAASAIAAGNTKTTIARMNGSYVNADPEEVYNTAKQILEANPEDWTQVGMNPYRASYFYDKTDGMPVTSADQVIQVGPLVFAKNAKKTTPDDEMFQFTNKRTGVTANFSEGGMALEEQMAMNFGDVPDNTIGQDPVSGNDIPLGSTAENVRDDIPANLSEGEIVVPADVVNFHGVKLFEDLRREAKLGYAQMAEDGRIGGEPMDMDEPMEEDELGLELADLEIIELAEEPVTMDKGGYNSKPPKFKNRYEKIMYYLAKFMQDEEKEEEKKLKGPSIAEQINFGGKYNEGGMASDEQPFYSQKGGFDMSRADVPMGSPIGDTGTVPTGMVELREYMNDAGHKIVITFVDGEPTTDIPVGYYPVSTIVTPSPSVSTPSDKDDKPSMPMPEGINYKELSVQELTDMVSGQQDSKITNMVSKLAMASNPVMGILMKVAMADQSRKLKAEVQRRLDDPATTDLDRMKLNNLMEIEGESTFIERLFGKEPAKMIAKPKDNEAFIAAAIADPEKFLAPVDDVYEPEVTTPEITGLDPETVVQQDDDDEPPFVQKPKDPIPPVSSGFPAKPDPAEEFGGSQTRFQPDDDDDDEPTFAPTPTPPANSGFSGMGPDPAEQFGGSPTRRTGGGGRNKGGLMKAKKKK